MGIDTCIYFTALNGVSDVRLEQDLPDGFDIRSAPSYGPLEATHEVDNWVRYYGKYYERGPWTSISSVLMLLLNSPDIGTVWYYGDCHDPIVCTPEIVLELSAHFMKFGERPYRGDWE